MSYSQDQNGNWHNDTNGQFVSQSTIEEAMKYNEWAIHWNNLTGDCTDLPYIPLYPKTSDEDK